LLFQGVNELRANVFQKLLAKYRAGKARYQALKGDLEKVSGEPSSSALDVSSSCHLASDTFCLQTLLPHISLYEAQLASLVPAREIDQLCLEHEVQVKDL
jgi:hypothetical protein